MMMRLYTFITGLVFVVPLANAEPSSAVAFDVPTVRMLKAADPANGEAIAEAQDCAKCHGDAGISDDEDDINIAGMSRSYLYKQLKDYKDKKRDSRDMYKRVRDLEGGELADLAAFYAALEPPQPAADRPMTDQVWKLVFKGDPERLLKACAACHGRDGRGGQYDHPALAGQHYYYLVDSMTEFREGDRENDIYGRMRDVSNALTEEEIEALARYYAIFVPEE